MLHAAANRSGPMPPCSYGATKNPVRPARQESREAGLAHREGQRIADPHRRAPARAHSRCLRDLEPRIQYEVEVCFQILTVAPGIKGKLRLVAGPRVAGSIGIVLEVELSRERHMQRRHDRDMDVSGAS